MRGQVVGFSKDGKSLITIGADRRLHHWDTADGKERHHAQLEFPIDRSEFDLQHIWKGRSPNHRYYISADREHIRVWNSDSGKEVHKIPNPTFMTKNGSTLSRLAVSDNGNLIAGSLLEFRPSKCPTYLWNRATGKEFRFTNEEGDYAYPAISPDSKTLVIAGQKGVIRLYDTTNGNELRQIKTSANSANPNVPAVSPDNTTIAWLDGSSRIKLWSLADGKERATFELGEVGRTFFMQFSFDGERLALASEKGVLIWDLVNRKECQRFESPQASSFLSAQFGEIAFSPDGKVLAVSRPGGARLYDVAGGKLLLQPTGLSAFRQISFAYSPDCKSLAAASFEDGAIHIWEAASGKPLITIPIPSQVNTLIYPSDSVRLLTGHRDGSIYFWNTKTGKQLGKLAINDDPSDKIQFPVIRLASDGTTLSALGSQFVSKMESRHRKWELTTSKLVKQVDFPGRFTTLFAPNGSVLHLEGKIDLVDPLSKKLVLTLPELGTARHSFSWDSRRLAIIVGDATRIFDLSTRREIAKIPTKGASDVEFSRDGRLIAAIRHVELSLWEIASAQCVLRLPAPAPFSAADQVPFSIRTAFAPDGKSIATALKDTSILLWDITPGLQRESDKRPDLEPRDFDQLWADLSGDDAAKAYRAVWTFAGTMKQVMPLLRDRLKPAVYAGKHVDKLIAELDHPKFPVRKAAFKELENQDIDIEPSLRRTLTTNITPECRRRIEELLALPPGIVRQRDVLRGVRAVHALEASGFPPARDFLKKLAGGADEARMTQDAAASLKRLQSRGPILPID